MIDGASRAASRRIHFPLGDFGLLGILEPIGRFLWRSGGCHRVAAIFRRAIQPAGNIRLDSVSQARGEVQ